MKLTEGEFSSSEKSQRGIDERKKVRKNTISSQEEETGRNFDEL